MTITELKTELDKYSDKTHIFILDTETWTYLKFCGIKYESDTVPKARVGVKKPFLILKGEHLC